MKLVGSRQRFVPKKIKYINTIFEWIAPRTRALHVWFHWIVDSWNSKKYQVSGENSKNNTIETEIAYPIYHSKNMFLEIAFSNYF